MYESNKSSQWAIKPQVFMLSFTLGHVRIICKIEEFMASCDLCITLFFRKKICIRPYKINSQFIISTRSNFFRLRYFFIYKSTLNMGHSETENIQFVYCVSISHHCLDIKRTQSLVIINLEIQTFELAHLQGYRSK